MPETGIHELIPDEELNKKKVSLQSIIKLEQYFSVSHSLMLVRLKMPGLIDAKTYDQLKTYKATETTQQFGFDTGLYRQGNHNVIIGDYGEKAKMLFDIEKISEGHYIELMQQIGIDITNPEHGDENRQARIASVVITLLVNYYIYFIALIIRYSFVIN